MTRKDWTMRKRTLSVLGLVCALLLGCSKRPASSPEEAPAADPATQPPSAQEQPSPSIAKPAEAPGIVTIDGSSTVFPISEAFAEEFQKQSKAKVTIGVSGTGGGFKKFCAGEVAIAGASRPIKPTEEQACTAAKLEYIELPIAYDGLAIVVNPKNTWAKTLTVAELKKIWEPEAQDKVKKWSQIRKGFPDKDLRLFGAGVDSGTYDYFTKAIVGEEHKSRGDYTSSEDDNVIVQGVSRDVTALGFFGLAYYEQNPDKLALVAIDDGNPENGKGPILPTAQTVADGTYQPLSRPIFVYVSKAAAAKPEVKEFIDFSLANADRLVKDANYIPLPAKTYELVKKRFATGVAGSVFAGAGSQVGVSVESLLARE
jgi:phosphate transport system substrate-binding protein